MGAPAQETAGDAEVLTDISHWPVLVLTPGLRVTDEGMRANIREFERIVGERPEPYAVVLDLRVCQGLSSAQRRMHAQALEREDVSRCLGLGMVFTSRFLRGLLTAMLWVRRPPYPLRVFARLEDAMAWARRRVSERTEPGTGEVHDTPYGDSRWNLVAGTFATRADAEALVSRIEATQMLARILETGREPRLTHVVQIDGFASRSEAMIARERLRSAGIDSRLERQTHAPT